MNQSRHHADAVAPVNAAPPPPPAPRQEHHRLDQLPAGAGGVVQHIERADAALHRLMAMGLCVGREIKVVRQGNPLIVRLLGARVGVSSRLARQITVAAAPGGH